MGPNAAPLATDSQVALLRDKSKSYAHLLRALTDWFVGRDADSFLVVSYHLVRTGHDPYYAWAIPLPDFEQQLRVFQRHCSVLSLDDICQRLEQGSALPARCVALTFDDGFRDLYTLVAPLLKGYGLPATVYVAVEGIERGWLWPDLLRYAIRRTERAGVALETMPDGPCHIDLSSPQKKVQAAADLDRRLKGMSNDRKETALQELTWKLLGLRPQDVPNGGLMLSWEELEAISRGGITIGAHTMTHPILSQMPPDEAAWEITTSRRLLQERLGVPVDHFAYPNGTPQDFSPAVEALARHAGFRSAATTVSGVNRSGQDRFRLHRLEGAEEVLRDVIAVLEPA